MKKSDINFRNIKCWRKGFHKNILKSAENAEHNDGETKMLTKSGKLTKLCIFKW